MKRLTARQYAQALYAAFEEATPEKRQTLLPSFLQQLTRRRLMKLMPRILTHLQKLDDDAHGLTRVRAWTAQAIDPTALQATLQKSLGPTVIEAHTEPNVFGGLKLQIGDQVIDGTLRNRLHRLHTHLSESS